MDVNLADIQCKFNSLSMINHCEYIIQQDAKQGKTYNITLCAENEFGKTCQSSVSIISPPTAPVNQEESALPVSIILGIVISIVVAVLLISLLLICFTVINNRKKAKEIDQDDNERFVLITSHSFLRSQGLVMH